MFWGLMKTVKGIYCLFLAEVTEQFSTNNFPHYSLYFVPVLSSTYQTAVFSLGMNPFKSLQTSQGCWGSWLSWKELFQWQSPGYLQPAQLGTPVRQSPVSELTGGTLGTLSTVSTSFMVQLWLWNYFPIICTFQNHNHNSHTAKV